MRKNSAQKRIPEKYFEENLEKNPKIHEKNPKIPENLAKNPKIPIKIPGIF